MQDDENINEIEEENYSKNYLYLKEFLKIRK